MHTYIHTYIIALQFLAGEDLHDFVKINQTKPVNILTEVGHVRMQFLAHQKNCLILLKLI